MGINAGIIDGRGDAIVDANGAFIIAFRSSFTIPADDVIGYIFQFTDLGAAERDPIVGTYIFIEVIVFQDTAVNSVTYLPGYWCMIKQTGTVSALLYHQNLEIVVDVTTRQTIVASFNANRMEVNFQPAVHVP